MNMNVSCCHGNAADAVDGAERIDLRQFYVSILQIFSASTRRRPIAGTPVPSAPPPEEERPPPPYPFSFPSSSSFPYPRVRPECVPPSAFSRWSVFSPPPPPLLLSSTSLDINSNPKPSEPVYIKPPLGAACSRERGLRVTR